MTALWLGTCVHNDNANDGEELQPPFNEIGHCRQGLRMNKAISAFLLLAMLIQIIKPLGLPGLRRRSDLWKLAVVAFVAWSVTLLLRP